jgi:hypothetical protein
MSNQPAYRIVEHRDAEDPEQLLAHPDNWRIHSGLQEEAVEGAIDEIGFVRAVLVNRRSGRVLDGHLRIAIAIRRGYTVPVDYVDLTEDEEYRVLALLDSTAALAGTDDEKVKAVIAAQSVPENRAIALMFDRSLDAAAIIAAVGARTETAGVANPAPPSAAFIVECHDAGERRELMDRLRSEGFSCRALRGQRDAK